MGVTACLEAGELVLLCLEGAPLHVILVSYYVWMEAQRTDFDLTDQRLPHLSGGLHELGAPSVPTRSDFLGLRSAIGLFGANWSEKGLILHSKV